MVIDMHPTYNTQSYTIFTQTLFNIVLLSEDRNQLLSLLSLCSLWALLAALVEFSSFIIVTPMNTKQQ